MADSAQPSWEHLMKHFPAGDDVVEHSIFGGSHSKLITPLGVGGAEIVNTASVLGGLGTLSAMPCTGNDNNILFAIAELLPKFCGSQRDAPSKNSGCNLPRHTPYEVKMSNGYNNSRDYLANEGLRQISRRV